MPTIPTIPVFALINKATVPLGCDLNALANALNIQLSQHYAPAYGLPGPPATVIAATTLTKGMWPVWFFDTADVAGALAYHDLANGAPECRVFAKTTIANGSTVSCDTSHEVLETVFDQWCAYATQLADGRFISNENCDSVEEATYKINGIEVSNFVLPKYFDPQAKSADGPFDYLGLLKKPAPAMLPGGYNSVFKSGRWSQIYGSVAKAKRFAKEDRRGHRTELRKRKRAA